MTSNLIGDLAELAAVEGVPLGPLAGCDGFRANVATDGTLTLLHGPDDCSMLRLVDDPVEQPGTLLDVVRRFRSAAAAVRHIGAASEMLACSCLVTWARGTVSDYVAEVAAVLRHRDTMAGYDLDAGLRWSIFRTAAHAQHAAATARDRGWDDVAAWAQDIFDGIALEQDVPPHHAGRWPLIVGCEGPLWSDRFTEAVLQGGEDWSTHAGKTVARVDARRWHKGMSQVQRTLVGSDCQVLEPPEAADADRLDLDMVVRLWEPRSQSELRRLAVAAESSLLLDR